MRKEKEQKCNMGALPLDGPVTTCNLEMYAAELDAESLKRDTRKRLYRVSKDKHK